MVGATNYLDGRQRLLTATNDRPKGTILAGNKRDRMTAAACTRAVLAACSEDGMRAVASTVRAAKRGYWAVTRVRPTDDGFSGSAIVAILANSHHVPAADVKIEGSWLNNTVKVWWRE